MIEKILDVALWVYTVYIIVIFTAPPIIGIAVNGIEGLKDMLNMIKDKDYYIHVAIPVIILVTFANIIGFSLALLIK